MRGSCCMMDPPAASAELGDLCARNPLRTPAHADERTWRTNTYALLRISGGNLNPAWLSHQQGSVDQGASTVMRAVPKSVPNLISGLGKVLHGMRTVV